MRLHLFEFEDQSWMPHPLRDAMTLYLASVYRKTQLPSAWAAKIADIITRTGENRIVDLGSGAAGPIPLVSAELRKLGCPVQVTLTDLYPNGRAAQLAPDIISWLEPVDARAVPARFHGLRTMFASFHHFKPNDARKILADAVARRTAICIFEGTSRTAPAIASAVLIPLFVLLLTPTVRPVSAAQLIFTYLIPVLPLLIFWDGLVSHLRTYTPDELIEMTKGLDAPGYQWTAGIIPIRGLPTGVPYMVGESILKNPA